MMKERIIVTMTTYSKRINNIPAVLETIFNQTFSPDLVVINLAHEEAIPIAVQAYINQHGIEIYRVEDTKVYKKLIPTLKRYPDDCIISIDDDWLYPKGMIEDFMNIHKHYPDNPVSGNKEVICGIQCHCGCASLSKASFWGDYLDVIDDDLMKYCMSDDMVYSFLSTLAGHPYVRTNSEYFTNMIPFNPIDSYSQKCYQYNNEDIIQKSYDYLVNRFGEINNVFSFYVKDKYIANLLDDIQKQNIGLSSNKVKLETKKQVEDYILSTYSYRIGHFLLKPFSWVKMRFRDKQYYAFS